MFDRIIMDVFHMPDIIDLIPDHMFPVSSLPNRFFMLRFTRSTQGEWVGNAHLSGKIRFDQSPAPGEIGISRRQCPDTMNMLGQDNDGIEIKWVVFENLPESSSQVIHGFIGYKYPLSIVCNQSEKERTSL
jgi:hypothetical protein